MAASPVTPRSSHHPASQSIRPSARAGQLQLLTVELRLSVLLLMVQLDGQRLDRDQEGEQLVSHLGLVGDVNIGGAKALTHLRIEGVDGG